MKKVGFWNWLGLFIGIAVIITGIVILILCLNVSPYGGTFGRWSVEYGADFYTDVAQHLRSVNNSVENILSYVNILTYIFGVSFILGGLLVVCHYGKQMALTHKPDNEQAIDINSEIIGEIELVDSDKNSSNDIIEDNDDDINADNLQLD